VRLCRCSVVRLCGSGLQQLWQRLRQLLQEEVLPPSLRWSAGLLPPQPLLQEELLQQLQHLQQLCGSQLLCVG